jgi:Fic family protein
MREKEGEEFVVEFTYDTNRIEGASLTFQETADLLNHGVSPHEKPMRDVWEALSHANLLRRLLERPEPIDLPHLLVWHKAVFGETKSDIAGRIRDFEVRIGRSRHGPPSALEVRPMLVELLRKFHRHSAGMNPVDRAATFHFQFENIHPFGDGNGRIGRPAINLMLFTAGLPMLNIRYGKRQSYSRALERSRIASNPRPFVLWFSHRYERDQSWWFHPKSASPVTSRRHSPRD